MSQYSKLKELCKKNKIKVTEVTPRTLLDYAGMNDEAAKKFGFRRMKNNSIFIDKTMKSNTKFRTLKHEIIEMHLMGKIKMPYWSAHKIATKLEKK